MLLWIDESLVAFRRAEYSWYSKDSLFVYAITFNQGKLVRGDYDDGGFEEFWIYPTIQEAVDAMNVFAAAGCQGSPPDGWVTHKNARVGKKVKRKNGDPANEWVEQHG